MFTQIFPPHFTSKNGGSICFCVFQGRLLALKRCTTSFQGGLWTAAPGGKIESGETPLLAAVRETFEETGLRIFPEKLKQIGVFYSDFPDAKYTLHVFLTRLSSSQEVKIDPREHTEYRWATFEEAMELPLMRGGVECLRALYPFLLRIGDEAFPIASKSFS